MDDCCGGDFLEKEEGLEGELSWRSVERREGQVVLSRRPKFEVSCCSRRKC